LIKTFIAAIILFVLTVVVLFGISSHSALAINPLPKAIGVATPLTVRVVNPHGVRRIKITLEQSGSTTTLTEDNRPSARWTFWRHRREPEELHFTAGSRQAPGLKEGQARIVVETESNDFRGLKDSVAADVPVILRPPSVSADVFQHYINQGGAEMAMFTVSGSWTDAGVRVGNQTFRSFPVAGDPNQRLALFAHAWDAPPDLVPLVYAKNLEGIESKGRFWFKIFPKRFRARDFTIDDAFLEKVVNQIDPTGPGDLLSRFLKINGATRRENDRALAELRFKTKERFLWRQPFLQMANSKVESSFADVRSYLYKGKKVDQEVHLGFDLAVGQHTPVPAANDGKVVWAAPLGIYGNCIVVDHGYGLQSIYGHLSEISVKEGQTVARGETMGRSGSTGLAGGDHLHFSMQIDGVQVNPIEWWDDHWLNDHIRSRLSPGRLQRRR
jgi:murein DD-endopeptidase MepM/ murein hydrolase activator NlpD